MRTFRSRVHATPQIIEPLCLTLRYHRSFHPHEIILIFLEVLGQEDFQNFQLNMKEKRPFSN